MPRGEEGRAEESALLVVEEDEGTVRPLLLAHAADGLHQRQHARGVVVDRVGVGRAQQEHIEHRAEADQQPEEHARDADARREQPGHGGHQRQEGERDQHVIEQIDQKVLRRNEIGEGQPGTGVIVGGKDHLSRVRIPEHQVAAAEQAALLDAQTGEAALHHLDEGQLLPLRLADLPVLQDLVRQSVHRAHLLTVSVPPHSITGIYSPP